MKLILSIGVEKIATHLTDLTGAIKEGAMQRGYNLVTPIDPNKHGAMIAIRSHKVDLLVKRLKEHGVITSSRDNNLRVSPHIYNEQSDIDKLFDCLAHNRDLLV